MSIKSEFLALNPLPGVRYTLFGVLCGKLEERFSPSDSSGSYLLLRDGEVWLSKAVIEDNTYRGRRYPLELLD